MLATCRNATMSARDGVTVAAAATSSGCAVTSGPVMCASRLISRSLSDLKRSIAASTSPLLNSHAEHAARKHVRQGCAGMRTSQDKPPKTKYTYKVP